MCALLYPFPPLPPLPSFRSSLSPPSSSSSPRTKPCATTPLKLRSLPLSQPITRSLPHHQHHADSDEFLAAHYCTLLQLSIATKDIRRGKSVHAVVLKTLLHDHQLLANNLITVYTKLGYLPYAVAVFKSMASPNLVSWTAMVCGYANFGKPKAAINIFFRMRDAGMEPNEFGFLGVLIACGRLLALRLALQIHGLVLKLGYMSSIHVSNALMAVYVKCGRLDSADQVFDEMPRRDAVSYNTVISSWGCDFQSMKAFEILGEMRDRGYRPDQYTLSSVISASARESAIEEGKQLHAYALRAGFEANVAVNNALISFYTKCCGIEDLENLFRMMLIRDVVSWTGMITGYAQHGLIKLAARMFDEMPERNAVSYSALLAGFVQNGEGSQAVQLFIEMLENGIGLSTFTLTSAVNACSLVSGCAEGQQIHAFAWKTGFWMDSYIEGSLIDMYAKCGRIEDARKLFDNMPESNSIEWASIISGYSRNGLPDAALFQFLKTMEEGNIYVDRYVISAILGACGALGFQEMGNQLHAYAITSGLLADVSVGNSVLSMYSKCGFMDMAKRVFGLMPEHDVVSWNALIMGYNLHRLGDMALDVFTEMEISGVKPDDITFIAALSACRYTSSDAANRCRRLFDVMSAQYGIEPHDEHYACVVDVLSHAGRFQEAEEFINQIPDRPGAPVWRTLLDSAGVHRNLRIGKLASQHLLGMQPQGPATYVLVSNLYSASGRWDCSEKVKEEMRKKGMRKHPARSWTIIRNKIHSFYARDRTHLQAKDIYSGLEILIVECRKAGYVPDTSFVLHEVEEYQKENFLYYHSSKLALTYGLLMTKPGKPVQVVKNVHLCGDCHEFMKYVSEVAQRDISMRDSTGFHYFNGGRCSCKDCW
ncbi:Pentatricopeptide repeat-containing protein [Nymphaea thermarum]|nr:Pentatricopeptide repeat-containing protein [Nymphaea thermarum]